MKVTRLGSLLSHLIPVKNTVHHLCLLLPRTGTHKIVPWQAPEDYGALVGRLKGTGPIEQVGLPAHLAREGERLVGLLMEAGNGAGTGNQ